MKKRKARADPKELEFSKVIMKQEMQLLWINTLGVLGLAYYCVHNNFDAAFPWLSAMGGMGCEQDGIHNEKRKGKHKRRHCIRKRNERGRRHGMKDATFLMGNWYLFIAALAMATLAAAAVARFLEMPSAEQRKKVKEWLLLAVTEAEKELGSGTGQLKLRYVYDLFLQRFPAVAKRISFETFSYWVDRALIDMREMLSKNKAIYRMVKAEEGAENGTD